MNTPRTDAFLDQLESRPDNEGVFCSYAELSNFTRTLETELQTAQAEILGLREALEDAGHADSCRFLNYAGDKCDCHMQALATPPPPVVPVERMKEA